MSIDIYRGTRIAILGDSETVGHNAGDPLIFPWQRDLHDKLKVRYGPDRPILLNEGTNGADFVSCNANFATTTTPHNCDVLFLPIMTNCFAIATGTLTTQINTLFTTVQTASSWRSGKLPRAVLCIGAMCSSGVASDDWSADSSAFTTRNAIYSARAAANGYAYADPLTLWQSIETQNGTVTVTGTDNGVPYTVATFNPINPSRIPILANGKLYTNDGTHVTINGSKVWSAAALSQINFRDEWEPGA